MKLQNLLNKKSWKAHLQSEFAKDYMLNLNNFLNQELNDKKIIYPSAENIFKSLNEMDFDAVKVVILGQDPYHGEGQAHGLAFSVPKGVKIPPSLRNIVKEIKDEFKDKYSFSSEELSSWAKQGVLLLNATLTVEAGKANSHKNKGWEEFTNRVIEILNKNSKNIVYLLWGGSAQKKGAFIDRDKNLVLEAPHPSPLSSYRGFFGCKHFVLANEYLIKHGRTEIDWST